MLRNAIRLSVPKKPDPRSRASWTVIVERPMVEFLIKLLPVERLIGSILLRISRLPDRVRRSALARRLESLRLVLQ
jgi:hypothetical protein